MKREWISPLVFFAAEIILLAIPTAIFFKGFFLTKRETGLKSHPNPFYQAHPPIYVIHPEKKSHHSDYSWLNINKLIPGNAETQSRFAPTSPWFLGNVTRLDSKSVTQNFQQWKQSLRSSSCTNVFTNHTNSLKGLGEEICQFLSCRITELSGLSEAFMHIWANSEQDVMNGNKTSDVVSNSLLKNLELGSVGLPTPINKVILIVIDALRFDFVKQSKSTLKTDYHLNQMKFLNKLLIEEPNKTRLFPFIADAPTATAQRLRALVSGTLPTFFEVSESFTSSQVSEDTLLSQLWLLRNAVMENHIKDRENGAEGGQRVVGDRNLSSLYKSVIMGDDTWDSLFGHNIDRSYPFPSFDIKDLDTVDNGVLAHIWDELEQ